MSKIESTIFCFFFSLYLHVLVAVLFLLIVKFVVHGFIIKSSDAELGSDYQQ